jgi:cold shock protein
LSAWAVSKIDFRAQTGFQRRPFSVLKHAQRSGAIMASGKVKWFDNQRGFGFITQSSGQDVFVYHSSIIRSGYKTLEEGDEVSFEIITSEKGPKAQNVQRVNPA